MHRDDKAMLALCAMIIFMIMACIAGAVTDDIMTAEHAKPDMSKCELMSDHSGKKFWYECPLSVAK